MTRTLAILILFLLYSGATVIAQPDLRAQLFSETERSLQAARDKQAPIYAPKSFAKGMEAYNDADDYFKRGKPIEKIQERLRDATSSFNRSADAAALGEKTFSMTMAARTDAFKVNAPAMYGEMWARAEAAFREAAGDLEDGDLSDARKEANTAEGLYRKAELESIKAKYLNPARGLLRQAEDLDTKDDAPKTLAKAQRLSADAEAQFAQNRYDNAAAQSLARQSQIEASHALYIQRAITQLKRENRTYEDILLSSEEPIRRIAAALNIDATFDSGVGPPTQKILGAISTPDNEKGRLVQTVKTQDSTIAALTAKLSVLEHPGAPAAEAKTDRRAQLDDVAAQIRSMFIPDEATIQIDGNNILLRIFAVSFPPGKTTLDERSRSVLARVTQSILKLPGSQVSVEGHTEPIGSEIANQRNSEERAESVANFLRADLPSSIAITFAGYGGSRPIGGTGKNKRIDVVIVPEWAIVGK